MPASSRHPLTVEPLFPWGVYHPPQHALSEAPRPQPRSPAHNGRPVFLSQPWGCVSGCGSLPRLARVTGKVSSQAHPGPRGATCLVFSWSLVQGRGDLTSPGNPTPHIQHVEPCTKVTGVEPYTKVTGQKSLELTKPRSNCYHKPPDLNQPVPPPYIK